MYPSLSALNFTPTSIGPVSESFTLIGTARILYAPSIASRNSGDDFR